LPLVSVRIVTRIGSVDAQRPIKARRVDKLKGWKKRGFQILFLGSFGFTGGVFFLLFFLVPFEQWSQDRGTSQQTINVLLTLGWVVTGIIAMSLYSFLFLQRRRDSPAAFGILIFALMASFGTFYFLLDTDLMAAVGQLGEGSVENDQLTFGPYPDAQQIEELKKEGYDGIITLLNPSIPFEKVLLDQELKQGEETGIEVYSYPMLPWISENKDSLAAIQQLVAENEDHRYYIHCYLGKHRVELVRRELTGATEDTITVEEEPLKSSLERGRLSAFDQEQIVLGPYPTDEEWVDAVLHRNFKEIVSTLDPTDDEDVPWIEQERQIAEDNGLIFTQEPLSPESPDPATVQEIADYVRTLDHKVYVHDFNVSERFRAVESALQKEDV
jgi:protein tyrosine phosphatase (PTP) superfamily phosphohydrolase (DUF442 family)